MRTYTFVYFGAALLAIFGTPIIIRIARSMNIVDNPGVRKVHASAIPRLGGVIIVASMLLAVIPVLALDNVVGRAFRDINIQVFALLGASVLIFFAGLVDDIRDMRARTKLLVQLVAAIIICGSGIRIDEINLTETYVVQFGWLAWPITIVWIVGITNAVNLIDGLDGLAAGVSAITCGVLTVFAIYTGQPVMAVLMLALLGSLSGFLFFNFNPAKIFMGDCGSLFLGFMLASSSVLCATKTAALVGLAMPVLALGIPILDTLFSMLRRILERRSMFAPDRGHIHHRLLEMGLNQRHAVIVMYAVTLIAASLGAFMIVIRGEGIFIVFAGASFFLLMVFRIVGAVRLRESFAAFRRNMAIFRDTKAERRGFEDVQLRVRQAASFGDWWQAVCAAGERMEFIWLALDVTNRNGESETLIWRHPRLRSAAGETVSMNVPLRHRRSGGPLQIELVVRVNGSLESAGRRAALFIRLIDEHSLADLPRDPRPPAHRPRLALAQAKIATFSKGIIH